MSAPHAPLHPGATVVPAATLYRLSAWCLIGSFVLSLAGGLAHPVVDGESHSVAALLADRSPWAQYLIYAGALLLMLGLPGGYLWLRERGLGVLGLVGAVGYLVGNALSAMSHLVVEGFVAPTIARDAAARPLIGTEGEIVDAPAFVTLQVVGGLVLVLSLVVLAVALLRAPGVPRWIGGVLLAGSLLLLVPLPERPVLTGLVVELPRGLAVAAIGVLVLRGLRSGGSDDDVAADVRAREAVPEWTA